ncbi:hypothetical protein Zmor_021766 [Zophobas morio]|uniref:Uncharacterized protein n=1 Tax=Zophobas morio TaxID=2755281 RepID=A0AA38I6C2_9CUCU|nr:hypothetical protein Zmor_021766 [Zophobas morio]
MKASSLLHLNFPIPPDNLEHIHKYFSICKLSVVFDRNILIYIIQIPLVSEETFHLYHLIPLPSLDKNSSSTFSYIDTDYPYLLISTTKMQYGRLKDLSACKTIYEDDFICQDAITYMVNQHPVCEILLKVQQLDQVTQEPMVICPIPSSIWHNQL